MKITQIQHICKLFYSYASKGNVGQLVNLMEKIGWYERDKPRFESGEFELDYCSGDLSWCLSLFLNVETYGLPPSVQDLVRNRFNVKGIKFNNVKFGEKDQSVMFVMFLVAPLFHKYLQELVVGEWTNRIGVVFSSGNDIFLNFIIKVLGGDGKEHAKVDILMKGGQNGEVYRINHVIGDKRKYGKKVQMDESFKFLFQLEENLTKILRMVGE